MEMLPLGMADAGAEVETEAEEAEAEVETEAEEEAGEEGEAIMACRVKLVNVAVRRYFFVRTLIAVSLAISS